MSTFNVRDMLHDAKIIYSKELRNILKDRRTLFAVLVLPLLLMPTIFIGIDKVTSMQFEQAQETTYSVQILNNTDESFLSILSSSLHYSVPDVPDDETIIIEFPKGYTQGESAQVAIHYNSTSQSSSFAAGRIEQALNAYNDILADKTLKQAGLSLDSLYPIKVIRIDTAPEEAQGTGFLAMMLPYMILIYTFAGSMSVGIDTTAGEKERGSLAIILVNQVSRTSIAFGKILYVLTVGITSSCMTFIGLIIAFLVTGGFFNDGSEFAGFSLSSSVTLLLVLIFTSMLAASIIILLGSLARTVKEASSYVTPVYIIVIVMGVLTMSLDAASQPFLFLVPFLNSVFLMKGAIIGESTLMQLLLMICSTSIIIALLIAATSRLYNSEKILEGPAA